jgi:hypothetical protein
MKVHHLYHLLSELLFLTAIICPVAVVFAVLVGLPVGIFTGPLQGLNAFWISFCTVIGIVPLAVRLSGGPDTRVICEECIAMAPMAPQTWNHNGPRNDRRRHPRSPVNFRATFTNEHLKSFGMITDLSPAGCRIKIAHPCMPGIVGKILIDVPGGNGPLRISAAEVRWVAGNESGLAFGSLTRGEQGWLDHIVNHSHSTSLPQSSGYLSVQRIIGSTA